MVLPGSQSSTATVATPKPPGAVASVSPSMITPVTPSSDTSIPPQNVPLTPPPPPGEKKQTTLPPTIPPTSSAPPRRKPRRFRRFLLTLLTFIGLGYAGGIWYSLASDNFHDFFTEYIPFGEDAVLYLEERQFRKRFPNATRPTSQTPRDSGNKITIPSKSGLSWKVSEDKKGSDLGSKGRHVSALEENTPKASIENAQRNPSTATSKERARAVELAKKGAPPAIVTKSDSSAESPKNLPNSTSSKETQPLKTEPLPVATQSNSLKSIINDKGKTPEVNEPSVFVPITRIDPLKINSAEEPIVQDLVKILNDIITVINADNASGKFSTSISKAKNELAGVGRKIVALKDAEKNVANERVESTQTQFNNAAQELVRRVEEEMRDQEARWKDEFETEREKISRSYQDRLKSELERSEKLSEQRVRNQLLEQAVTLKKQFTSEVKDRVETERDGRLAKLSELSTSVNELEKLTSEWNTVIDANLKTQHMQVAVEAVRSSLELADRPRPFTKELAALKEIAADDPIVNSAIASINPAAYQRGVPTSSQVIDRFRRVAAEVRKAALLTEDAGVASHAASYLLSRVLFKKQGLAIGDDVESILTRTETLLEEGNLDEAARQMNGLTGWAKTLSGDWLGEVRRVLEARQALDVSIQPVISVPFAWVRLTRFPGYLYRSTTTKLKGGLSIDVCIIILYIVYCSILLDLFHSA